jgi:transposase
MALFPPVRSGGGGEGVAYGYKGKGVTTHELSDGIGQPLYPRVTPANCSEQHEVIPLLKKMRHWLGRVPKWVAADRGYDSDALRYKVTWFLGMGSSFDIRQYDEERKGQYRPTGHSKRTGRWQIERTFAWMYRRYSRITHRKERKEICFIAFVFAAHIIYWLEKVAEIQGI